MSESIPDPTPSQVDRLGKLRVAESISDADVTLLERYQASLAPLLTETIEEVRSAYEEVLAHEQFEVTVRNKQLRSIIAKLQREKTRLSSMQDLVGFRIVVRSAIDQEELLQHLPGDDSWRIMDRRQHPSHGYRAIHVIRRRSGGGVEVQIRTFLQHQWAELSELYDRISPGTKYGGGDTELQDMLATFSKTIEGIERLELGIRLNQQRHAMMHEEMISLLQRTMHRASGRTEP